jgi:hypothetical protein
MPVSHLHLSRIRYTEVSVSAHDGTSCTVVALPLYVLRNYYKTQGRTVVLAQHFGERCVESEREKQRPFSLAFQRNHYLLYLLDDHGS